MFGKRGLKGGRGRKVLGPVGPAQDKSAKAIKTDLEVITYLFFRYALYLDAFNCLQLQFLLKKLRAQTMRSKPKQPMAAQNASQRAWLKPENDKSKWPGDSSTFSTHNSRNYAPPLTSQSSSRNNSYGQHGAFAINAPGIKPRIFSQQQGSATWSAVVPDFYAPQYATMAQQSPQDSSNSVHQQSPDNDVSYLFHQPEQTYNRSNGISVPASESADLRRTRANTHVSSGLRSPNRSSSGSNFSPSPAHSLA